METMSKFWEIVKDVWQQDVYGFDISRILIAVLIFIFFLLMRKLFSRWVIYRLKKIVQKTETRLDDELLEILEKPIAVLSAKRAQIQDAYVKIKA